MADFEEFGGKPNKRKVTSDDLVGKAIAKAKNPLLEKSSAERLAEAMKSPLAGLASHEASLAKLRAVNSPLDKLTKLSSALSGTAYASSLENKLAEVAKSQERMRAVFGGNTMSQLASTFSASSEMETAIENARKAAMPEPRIEALAPLRLPPNPAHKTNKHLQEVGEKIDALLDVQAKQAGLIDLLLKSAVEGGKKQDRMAMWGLIIGFLGVLVAVVTLILA